MALNGIEHTFQSDPLATAITSVVRIGDTVWCGLTSGANALVPFDIKTKEWGDCVPIFPWVSERPQMVSSKIHNGMGALDDGRLVIGEGILMTWDGIPFVYEKETDLAAQNRRRELMSLPPIEPKEIGPTDLASFDMRWLPGGKILTYDPATGSSNVIGQLPTVAHYVQSMVVDSKNEMAYGHTIGDCHFFSANLKAGTIEDHGRISAYSFHNLMVAPSGIAYGGWSEIGNFDYSRAVRVLRFDPAKGFVERLPQVLLPDAGPRVQGNRGIDQWLVHSSGRIFVGTAGTGILYEFDEEKLCLHEVGKVGVGGRVTSLDEDEQGRVLLTGGFPKMSVGRYDLQSGQLEDFGPVTERYDHIYFHGSAYLDGVLYLAETDSGVASLWEVPLPD